MSPATRDLAHASIGQIAIVVHDLERAVAFYRDLLGMRYLFAVPKMAFLECGGVRLMLTLPEQAEFDHPASIIYYKVDQIERTYETLSGRGVPFESEPHLVARMEDHDLWMAFLRDPDRNVLGLMSEVPR